MNSRDHHSARQPFSPRGSLRTLTELRRLMNREIEREFRRVHRTGATQSVAPVGFPGEYDMQARRRTVGDPWTRLFAATIGDEDSFEFFVRHAQNRLERLLLLAELATRAAAQRLGCHPDDVLRSGRIAGYDMIAAVDDVTSLLRHRPRGDAAS
ncbi:MAG: hypothetical protein NXI31_13490 [bacterium]|nr:hypothetical protein [bacterium]